MRRSSALAFAAAGVLGAPRFVRAQPTLEKIQVAGPPTEDATNLYYAVKAGIPQRLGLEVEMIATSSGTAATTAVITGTYDTARTSLNAVFAAFLRGIPVVIVAPDNVYTSRAPFSLLQIAADSPYRTGADLNGKTIGTPALNDFNMLSTRVWVDKNGGDWRSLKFVEIPNSALEAAILQHRVDAAILQTAQLSASLAAGRTKTLGDALGAIAPTFLSGVYMARREWAAAHGETLRRFNRVLNEGTAYVSAHPNETAPLVAELTKIELADVAKMSRSINATSVDPAQLQPVIDACAKYEQIPHGFAAHEILYP
jgi:NitT/TauT family transport system substrate-binding protein